MNTRLLMAALSFALVALTPAVSDAQSRQVGPLYGRGYRTLSGSPAYLRSTRPPQLDYIQPQYQSAYRYDRGGPSFGFSYPYSSYPLLRSGRGRLYQRDYGFSSGYQPLYYQGATYRPYVTKSQYVYQPTFLTGNWASSDSPPVAVYGAYGYAAIYGD